MVNILVDLWFSTENIQKTSITLQNFSEIIIPKGLQNTTSLLWAKQIIEAYKHRRRDNSIKDKPVK